MWPFKKARPSVKMVDKLLRRAYSHLEWEEHAIRRADEQVVYWQNNKIEVKRVMANTKAYIEFLKKRRAELQTEENKTG